MHIANKIILPLSLMILLIIGCEETPSDIAILEFNIIDALNYDRVHCIVTQELSTVWESDVTITSNFQTVEVQLDPGGNYAARVQCFINDSLVYNGYVDSLVLEGGETLPVPFVVQLSPLAPTDLTAQPLSNSVISLAWVDNSTNENGFNIDRRTGVGNFVLITSVPANVSSYLDSGLVENTQYFYRVYAFSEVGNSGYSNEDSATTMLSLPLSPTDLSATCYNDTIKLEWDDHAFNEEGLIVERSLSGSGNFTFLVSLDPNTESYDDAAITSGELYYYRVYAFNSSGNSDFSNTASMTAMYVVSEYNTSGAAHNLVLDGDYIYVADGSQGLQIINVADPAFPFLVSNFYLEGTVGLAKSNDAVLLVNITADTTVSGLHIVDVADPFIPSEIAFYPIAGPLAIKVSGNYAYVTSYDLNTGKLWVFDISDPTALAQIGMLNFSVGEPADLAISGNFAYIACGTEGLRIVDLSDPASMTEVGSYTGTSFTVGVTVQGNYAYIAGGYIVKVVDISNPASPFCNGWNYDEPEYSKGLCVEGNRLFIPDYNNQLFWVADVSTPTAPFTLAKIYIESVCHPFNVFVTNGYAYIAAWDGGIFILYVGF